MTNAGEGAPLNNKLLAKITDHLNDDHRADLLACAKVKGELNWAEQVTAISLDETGIHLEVSGDGKQQSLHLKFPSKVSGVLGLRKMLETIITESRTELGWGDNN